MKLLFAYFTDVHGNIDALEAVIEDAVSQGADSFICGGDMIGIGPFTNEVLELLFSLPSIHMVTGNHDEAVLALKYDQPYPESHAHAKLHHQWIADQLNHELAEQLKKLPREIAFNHVDISFLITHYPFKQGKKESPISEDPFQPIMGNPTLELIEQAFGTHSNDFIGFGHHHIGHDFKGEMTHYVNPGALGCSSTAEARYALIYVDNHKVRVEFKSVPYDRQRLIKAYKELQIPDSDFLMKAFHGIS
ncbi:metallophosphoesterase family protein [Fictibacillus barbaricus]|uniref:Phosphodiesterase n=1 Tax=Fictibacillus barbaricus TaxID=182136 RepID=A0ABU1U5Z3_9BACL|nr:metallophosphoesterase family protein [Fictibacillus barbaricus]MDR7074919.1 putative phosphodiesterase [Fictibacillus barbaricus]